MDLPHLASRVYGTPLLVAPSKLEAILAVLDRRGVLDQTEVRADASSPQPRAATPSIPVTETSAGSWITEDRIAVVPIVGTMVRRGSFIDATSGLMSYQAVQRRLDAALADPKVRAVLLEMDTQGGEAGGVFDLADHIRQASAASGKPIWSVSNEMALSAGYALAAPTARLWTTQTGQVGSIGVVAAHVDQSAADRQRGLKVTYIHAGKHKVDGNPHEPLPDNVRSDLQRDIDALYSTFVEGVASARRMTPEAVRATEARVYRGQEALTAGLADEIGTVAEAAAELARSLDRPSGAVFSLGGAAARSHQKETPVMAKDDAQTPAAEAGATQDVASTSGNVPATNAPTSGPVEQASEALPETGATEAMIRKEFAEIYQLAEQAKIIGVPFDAAKAIEQGIKPNALRQTIIDEAAARADAVPTFTMKPAPSQDTAPAALDTTSIWAARNGRK